MFDALKALAEQSPLIAILLLCLWFMLRGIKSGQVDIKDHLEKMSKRMDCFERSQHLCQLDIAKDYATKTELRREADRLDQHEGRIARLEGKQ